MGGHSVFSNVVEELDTDAEPDGSIAKTPSAIAPATPWAIPTPVGQCPVDLAEVESLLGASPAKRPRALAPVTPLNHNGTCSLSLDLAELEILLDLRRTITPETGCTDALFADLGAVRGTRDALARTACSGGANDDVCDTFATETASLFD